MKNYVAYLQLARDGAATNPQNKAIHLIDQVDNHHYQHVQLVRLPRGVASQHGQRHQVFVTMVDHVSNEPHLYRLSASAESAKRSHVHLP